MRSHCRQALTGASHQRHLSAELSSIGQNDRKNAKIHRASASTSAIYRSNHRQPARNAIYRQNYRHYARIETETTKKKKISNDHQIRIGSYRANRRSTPRQRHLHSPTRNIVNGNHHRMEREFLHRVSQAERGWDGGGRVHQRHLPVGKSGPARAYLLIPAPPSSNSIPTVINSKNPTKKKHNKNVRYHALAATAAPPAALMRSSATPAPPRATNQSAWMIKCPENE